MALDKQETIDLIALELNQADNSALKRVLGTAWSLYADGSRYRSLKVHAIDYLIGYYHDQVSYREGDAQYDLNQRIKNLERLREKVAVDGSGLTSVMPVSNLPNTYNPEDSAFPDDMAATGRTSL